MTILKWVKKIYVAADTLRSNEDNYTMLLGVIELIFIVIIVKILWPIKGWDWFGVVILTGITASVAETITNAVFFGLLDRICEKFFYAAQVYDMCMLARVRIGKQDKSKVMSYGKASDADVGIEYFLEQERKKSLYNAVRIKRKREFL